MTKLDHSLGNVYRLLGRRPPSLSWSKVEIALGLAAVSIGVVFGDAPYAAMLTPALMTLGGYLALAGHRSHIYDAMTRQTALIVARPENGHES